MNVISSLQTFIYFYLNKSAMSFYYAVAAGRKPGIYHTWDECKSQVHKFQGAVYKKFPSKEEAAAFIGGKTLFKQKKSNALLEFVTLGKQATPPTSSSKTSTRVWSKPNEKSTIPSRKRKRSDSNSLESTSSNSNDNKAFSADGRGFVDIYTDGACSSNGAHGAKAGVGVYFGNNSPLNVSEPVIGRATNNMAEIQAVTRAAEAARQAGIDKIRINTDSDFVIKCATRWLPGWKKRGWTTAANKPVINKAELQEMEAALKPLKVEWNHVRGHTGVHGNEEADKLARQGAERYNTKR